MRKIAALVLAAGKGTRMRSKLPKVLHKLAGKPLIAHVLDTCSQLKVEKKIIVIGHEGEKVQEVMGSSYEYAWQREQLGTGHAVMESQAYLTEDIDDVLLICGDTPLIQDETLSQMYVEYQQSGAKAAILTTKMENPQGYGRIIRDDQNNVLRIVEQKDGTEDELAVKEINSGTYIFSRDELLEALKQLKPNNTQKEYYITDVIGIFRGKGYQVNAFCTKDSVEIMGINSRFQLAEAEIVLKNRINTFHMEQGVTIIDPATTYIDADVIIGQDTIIYPFTFIRGKTVIGENNSLGPQTTIENSIISDGVEIKNSIIIETQIGDDCTIGPFSYLRPGNVLKEKVKVGDFTELKKTTVGKGSKIPHLSYIGDATIGENVNVGAGTITCNYDGKNKFHTVLEDNVFIGSNTNLVAPITIHKNAYVGAGSTIIHDVGEGALGIARGKQVNIPEWVEKNNQENKE
jgi:bifunctional UDP-N-acetylglucosamine pyrophosphorylase/glucosamine-1-phosphate N-acetyltransferase